MSGCFPHKYHVSILHHREGLSYAEMQEAYKLLNTPLPPEEELEGYITHIRECLPCYRRVRQLEALRDEILEDYAKTREEYWDPTPT